MISIDTNIIVRLLTCDDKAQHRKARKLFENSDLFIPETVILETEWVLRFSYEFSSAQICDAFTKLFGLPNIHTADSNSLIQAIQWHSDGLDFSDALHLAGSHQCQTMMTFDAAFV